MSDNGKTNNPEPGLQPPWMTSEQNQRISEQPIQPPVSAASSGFQTSSGESETEPSETILPPAPTSASEAEIPVAVGTSIFRKIIPIAVILIIVLLVAFVVKTILSKNGTGFQIPFLSKPSDGQVKLTYWGLWEPQQVMNPLIEAYQKDHPNIKIDYVFQTKKDYRQRLQSQLSAGSGPDIFRIHATWLPMFINQDQLASVPEGLINWKDYHPIMDNLKSNGQYYAVPLYFDSLALFYNTELFRLKNLVPPKNWVQLIDAARAITVAPGGKIQTSGIAMGTTSNVDHWSDILAMLMLQDGVDLTNPTGTAAEDALKFYTSFYRNERFWDETLPPSVYAFAQGKVAMIFAPSWRVFEIKEQNPDLNFQTLPVPQLSDVAGNQISWASFWVEGVSRNGAHKKEAWDFLQYLSQKENLEKLYALESQIRLFGEPYPKTDMGLELEKDPIIGAFVQQAPYAKTWYLCSDTYDNGINDKMIKYFEDAVNSVNQGKSPADALSQTAAGVKQVLNQYQIGSQTNSSR